MDKPGSWTELLFQSTLPLRGATWRCNLVPGAAHISIHAPLTGSDPHPRHGQVNSDDFNPRSPYGERPPLIRHGGGNAGFQSTLPLRGATFFGARKLSKAAISIHAPLTGSDSMAFRCSSSSQNFNPRSPYGERLSSYLLLMSRPDFNPRSPYGERPPNCWPTAKRRLFQSTLPLRGATGSNSVVIQSKKISIHAPLTGSDLDRLFHIFDILFQSTLPLRGATILK